ncbi:hypothetical protein Lepto7376_2292 [[Leptolyngbya] sp. PCC 7376]|uniref:hypothetical protein n=1 Tax=[Leptolyngbya] sp. PCC 7376 TaxID=111781 RepID=UPI00029F44B5|nr:hypothetical protein [[Leptolyngbya] sp. PCC 7376]AFY38582.1 hypothetical protein Lepto7376_2292 [[Leptolyngbya] sp. PCC 7376]
MNIFFKLICHLNYHSKGKPVRRSPRSEGGYVLFVIMMISLSTLGLLAAYAKITHVDKMRSTSSFEGNTAFYAAEASLNLKVEDIRQKFAGYNTPNGTPPTDITSCFDLDATNDGTNDFGCDIETFVSSSSDQAAFEAASYVIAKNNGQPTIGTVPRGEAFQNLNMQEYGFAIHAVAKKTVAADSELGASLKMDIKSRLIPMFQFAAFYANDLEILPGPTMNLRGPVHTNGSLYLGAGGTLFVHNQVTLTGELYNSRKNKNSTYSEGKVQIKDAAGNWQNLLSGGTGSTSQTNSAMNPELVDSTWGTQVQTDLEPVIIPSPSFIDATGAYYTNGDLRIEYKPADTATNNTDYLATVPFEIQVPDSSTGTHEQLTEGQLRSLRQPVMVGRDVEQAGYCNAVSEPSISALTSDNEVKRYIVEALQTAIASQVEPLQFTTLDTSMSDAEFANLKASFDTALTARLDAQLNFTSILSSGDTAQIASLNSIVDSTQLNILDNLSPEQIAAISYQGTDPDDGSTIELGERCFVAAPLRDIGRDSSSHQSPYRYYNDREGREMRLLQMNIESLTVWNRDGVYVEFNSGAVQNLNSGQGFSSDESLFERIEPDGNAVANSFQSLGLASSDTSEGGLVFHATVDQTTYPDAAGVDSPYGFVLTKGEQLMGLAGTASNPENTGLTFVSDHGVYVQGDYNIVNKQPASVLADSLNVLSNACRNQDGMINKKSGKNCNPDINNEDTKSNGATTEINSAFLAGTDITVPNGGNGGYNGGLENYPRFAESWSGKTLRYRGSFVSLGTSQHVSGKWSSQKYNPPGRDWEYDLDFNNADNLPPLSPRFVHVKQSSFERYLD